MGAMASEITSLTIVYSIVYSDAYQRKHQRSASLAFVLGTGEFPAQMTSNAENVSIWWRHHALSIKTIANEWSPDSNRIKKIVYGNRLILNWSNSAIASIVN